MMIQIVFVNVKILMITLIYIIVIMLLRFKAYYTIHEKCLKISTALNIVSFIISFLNVIPQPWTMLERQYIFMNMV